MKFTDNKGREWPLKRITVGDLDELVALGFDVEAVSEDLDRLGDLITKPRTFAALLWWFVGDAVTAAKVEPADFKKSLDGDAMARALTAIAGSIIDFFPIPPAKKQEAIRQLLAGAGGSVEPPTSVPGSPASTPDPSPSAT